MNSAPAPAPGPGPAGSDNRDYLDKALDAAEKKFGGQRFADPNKNRGMNEKITDFIRKMVEKVTGYDTLCLDPNFRLFCREAILWQYRMGRWVLLLLSIIILRC